MRAVVHPSFEPQSGPVVELVHVDRRPGDDEFFDLLKEWTREYRYSSVSTDDFTALAARHSEGSLNRLWQQWLYEKPLPPFPEAG